MALKDGTFGMYFVRWNFVSRGLAKEIYSHFRLLFFFKLLSRKSFNVIALEVPRNFVLLPTPPPTLHTS